MAKALKIRRDNRKRSRGQRTKRSRSRRSRSKSVKRNITETVNILDSNQLEQNYADLNQGVQARLERITRSPGRSEVRLSRGQKPRGRRTKMEMQREASVSSEVTTSSTSYESRSSSSLSVSRDYSMKHNSNFSSPAHSYSTVGENIKDEQEEHLMVVNGALGTNSSPFINKDAQFDPVGESDDSSFIKENNAAKYSSQSFDEFSEDLSQMINDVENTDNLIRKPVPSPRQSFMESPSKGEVNGENEFYNEKGNGIENMNGYHNIHEEKINGFSTYDTVDDSYNDTTADYEYERRATMESKADMCIKLNQENEADRKFYKFDEDQTKDSALVGENNISEAANKSETFEANQEFSLSGMTGTQSENTYSQDQLQEFSSERNYETMEFMAVSSETNVNSEIENPDLSEGSHKHAKELQDEEIIDDILSGRNAQDRVEININEPNCESDSEDNFISSSNAEYAENHSINSSKAEDIMSDSFEFTRKLDNAMTQSGVLRVLDEVIESNAIGMKSMEVSYDGSVSEFDINKPDMNTIPDKVNGEGLDHPQNNGTSDLDENKSSTESPLDLNLIKCTESVSLLESSLDKCTNDFVESKNLDDSPLNPNAPDFTTSINSLESPLNPDAPEFSDSKNNSDSESPLNPNAPEFSNSKHSPDPMLNPNAPDFPDPKTPTKSLNPEVPPFSPENSPSHSPLNPFANEYKDTSAKSPLNPNALDFSENKSPLSSPISSPLNPDAPEFAKCQSPLNPLDPDFEEPSPSIDLSHVKSEEFDMSGSFYGTLQEDQVSVGTNMNSSICKDHINQSSSVHKEVEDGPIFNINQKLTEQMGAEENLNWSNGTDQEVSDQVVVQEDFVSTEKNIISSPCENDINQDSTEHFSMQGDPSHTETDMNSSYCADNDIHDSKEIDDITDNTNIGFDVVNVTCDKVDDLVQHEQLPDLLASTDKNVSDSPIESIIDQDLGDEIPCESTILNSETNKDITENGIPDVCENVKDPVNDISEPNTVNSTVQFSEVYNENPNSGEFDLYKPLENIPEERGADDIYSEMAINGNHTNGEMTNGVDIELSYTQVTKYEAGDVEVISVEKSNEDVNGSAEEVEIQTDLNCMNGVDIEDDKYTKQNDVKEILLDANQTIDEGMDLIIAAAKTEVVSYSEETNDTCMFSAELQNNDSTKDEIESKEIMKNEDDHESEVYGNNTMGLEMSEKKEIDNHILNQFNENEDPMTRSMHADFDNHDTECNIIEMSNEINDIKDRISDQFENTENTTSYLVNEIEDSTKKSMHEDLDTPFTETSTNELSGVIDNEIKERDVDELEETMESVMDQHKETEETMKKSMSAEFDNIGTTTIANEIGDSMKKGMHKHLDTPFTETITNELSGVIDNEIKERDVDELEETVECVMDQHKETEETMKKSMSAELDNLGTTTIADEIEDSMKKSTHKDLDTPFTETITNELSGVIDNEIKERDVNELEETMEVVNDQHKETEETMKKSMSAELDNLGTATIDDQAINENENKESVSNEFEDENMVDKLKENEIISEQNTEIESSVSELSVSDVTKTSIEGKQVEQAAKKVDAALAELDSIPDELCDAEESEGEEEEEEEWSYIRMDQQTHTQGEDNVTKSVSNMASEVASLGSTGELPKSPINDINDFMPSYDSRSPLESPLNPQAPEFTMTGSFYGTLPGGPASPMEAAPADFDTATPDIVPNFGNNIDLAETVHNEPFIPIENQNNGYSNSPPHSPTSGSPPRTGSPRSVEGFVTSVDLNTPEESYNTNLAINQTDPSFVIGGEVQQNSGPISVYVSSSPEPSSLENPSTPPPTEKVPEDLLNMNGENPMVEIVHAQSCVEVPSSPPPSDVIVPEAHIASPTSEHMETEETHPISPSSDKEMETHPISPVISESNNVQSDNLLEMETQPISPVVPESNNVQFENIMDAPPMSPSMPEETKVDSSSIDFTSAFNAMPLEEPQAVLLSEPFEAEKSHAPISEPLVETITEPILESVQQEAIVEASKFIEDFTPSEPQPTPSEPQPTPSEPQPTPSEPQPTPSEPQPQPEVESAQVEKPKSPVAEVKAKTPAKTPTSKTTKTPLSKTTPAASKAASATKAKPTGTTPKPTTRTPKTGTPTPTRAATSRTAPAKPSTTAAKPAAAKPTTAKPTTARPTASKPTTTKPATTRPALSKPTADRKPTTTRPTSSTTTRPSATPKTTTTAPKPSAAATARRPMPSSTRPGTKPTTDKTDGKMVNGTSTKPTTTAPRRPLSSTTSTVAKKPTTTPAPRKPLTTAPKTSAVAKETKNTTNRAVASKTASSTTSRTSSTAAASRTTATSRTTSATSRTTSAATATKTASSTTKSAVASRTVSSAKSATTMSKVNGTSAASKTTKSLSKTSTTAAKTSVGVKKSSVSKTSSATTKSEKMAVTSATEAATAETAELIVMNGENKIADEETSVEVKEKIEVEGISSESHVTSTVSESFTTSEISEKMLTETIASEEVTAAETITEVLVNGGDH